MGNAPGPARLFGALVAGEHGEGALNLGRLRPARRGQLPQVGGARQEVRHVRRDCARQPQQLQPVQRHAGAEVEGPGRSVLGSAPRRREEHHVSLQRGREQQEIAADELDAIGHAVNLRTSPFCRAVRGGGGHPPLRCAAHTPNAQDPGRSQSRARLHQFESVQQPRTAALRRNAHVKANWMALPPTPANASTMTPQAQRLAMCLATVSGVTEYQPTAAKRV